MSRLAFYGRQWTVFDPNNKQHRQWFAEFQQRRSWSHCPVRFIVDDDHGDLLTMIQRKLIEYYTDQEFGKKKPAKKFQRTLTLIKD
jgi:hypothetical protein